MNRKAHIRDISAYVAIEDQVVVGTHGECFLGYQVAGVSNLTDKDIKMLRQSLAALLSDLRPGLVIQKTDWYTNTPCELPATSGSYGQERVASLYGRTRLQHRSRLYLTLPHPKTRRSSAMVNKWRPKFVPGNPLQNIEERKPILEQIGHRFTEMLQAFGVTLTRLTNEELDQGYYEHYTQRLGATDFTQQIYHHRRGLAVGNRDVVMVNAIKQGSRVAATSEYNHVPIAFTEPLHHLLDVEHVVNQVYTIEDTKHFTDQLEKRIRSTNSFSLIGGHQLVEDKGLLEEAIADITTSQHKLVSLGLSVMVFDSMHTPKVQDAFSKLGYCGSLVENIDALNLFFSLAPGYADSFYRRILMPANQAACYAFFGALPQSDPDGLVMMDRQGNPLVIDTWNRVISNRNEIVLGTTGSGKSNTVGDFIVQRHEQGYRQIVIDKGLGTRRMIEALEGHHISVDENFSINLFGVSTDAQGRPDVSFEKKTYLVAVLSTIWKKPDEPLSRIEENTLSFLLDQYFQDLEAPSNLTVFTDWFENYQVRHAADPTWLTIKDSCNVSELQLSLKQFVAGTMGNMFGKPSTLDISSHRLIGIDVEGIRHNPLAYALVSLSIIELTRETFAHYRADRKYLYLDECWSFLTGHMAGFIETMYRTVRKQNGAIVILTQGVDEIQAAAVGKAILNNSATVMVMPFYDKQTIDHLASVFGFTDFQVKLIQSLQTHTGREIFIRQDGIARVCRIELPPRLAATLSTDPKVSSELREIQKHKPNINHAITQYTEKRYG